IRPTRPRLAPARQPPGTEPPGQQEDRDQEFESRGHSGEISLAGYVHSGLAPRPPMLGESTEMGAAALACGVLHPSPADNGRRLQDPTSQYSPPALGAGGRAFGATYPGVS